MRRRVAVALLAGLTATDASADPCVGAGFDKPFPGAVGVSTRHVDVPSPRFPGLWQEGSLGGYGYRLYANGEVQIDDPAPEPTWSITLLCGQIGTPCTETTEGTPPNAALTTARRLGQCFVAPDEVKAVPTEPEAPLTAPSTEGWALGQPPTPPEPEGSAPDVLSEEISEEAATSAPEDAPADPAQAIPDDAPIDTPEELATEQIEVLVEDALEATPDPVPVPPCGLATIPEGTAGFTLQRLLVAAGANPGPVDGLPGRLTRNALVEVLGQDAGGLTTDDAITALDAFLCTPAE